ncbi:MAG: 3-oxoacyl-[acyl-carrier-protein] reductase [Bdellovibrionaceae bacterium]|jgi:3-oxoacyl-[acyl-carrier protein] reductase|nr:3-oxoacyl-[acyl-carrier-protein] reductase [Pseudobdellovibrionaceae bacterium]
MFDLRDKNIIVTGGSRGIGKGIVEFLASHGANIGFSYSSSEAAAQQIAEELPGEGHFCFQMNIADADSVKSALAGALEKMGSVDGLVNNAGITKDQILLRLKPEDFDQVIQTNLRGTFLCVKTLLKPMIKQKNGAIVNITSVIGQTGNSGQANYAASKAGIEAFTKSIAQEVASRNIRLNCVAPGFIQTEMTDAMEDKAKQTISEKIPLGRLGQARDIAQSVAFLLSENASYITGQTISVNGGLNM